jgi:hypothetical protein
VLSHGPQAPWQLGMFVLGANMRESLTCCHVKLGKNGSEGSGLGGPDPRKPRQYGLEGSHRSESDSRDPRDPCQEFISI